jgi:predicted phosphodiesterase
MKIEGNYESIYVVGDIHGEFAELVWQATEKYSIKNSVIILAGDCGFGFSKKAYYDNLYQRISGKLEKSGNMILCVRGNHDDPAWFMEGPEKPEWPRLKLIPDYTILEILGLKILCIGGATSTDQAWRKEYNTRSEGRGSSKRVWWIQERPVQVPESHLPVPMDIVVSHEAPGQTEPLILREPEMDYEVWNAICEDRTYLGKVLLHVHPREWYYGHYHRSIPGDFGDIRTRGLGIMEFFEIRLRPDTESLTSVDIKTI